MIDLVYEQAKRDAQNLACIVRTYGADSVWEMTSALDRNALVAMSVVLAGMVDVDRPMSELLEWIDGPAAAVPVPRRSLSPCGTHAAYIRHKARREQVDARCVEAERAYQRERKQRIRAAAHA